ncbi:hypothetical protein ElyMa_006886900 [Elysia marginata]|uniref:Uncharacterized protein n=1 Tax=Elysia marginata TaxID=1093978 RepID=A0AAV4JAZ9_9GAST|nr:hypothetical protein ElyMa_006886900 [Elysia marginata]
MERNLNPLSFQKVILQVILVVSFISPLSHSFPISTSTVRASRFLTTITPQSAAIPTSAAATTTTTTSTLSPVSISTSSSTRDTIITQALVELEPTPFTDLNQSVTEIPKVIGDTNPWLFPTSVFGEDIPSELRIAWLAPSGWTKGFSAQTTVNVFKQALFDASWWLPYTNIR